MSKKVVGIAQLKSALSSAGDKLVVVDVGASWCGPCKQIAPLVEDLAHQHQQKAVFLAVDGDASRDVVSHFGVQGFPTFVFLRNGVEVDRLVGADSSKLTSMVTRLCVKPEPRSTFSFPPAQFVLLQTGQISGIATFISGKVNNLGPAESAKLAALSSAADDGVAIALFSKEPGVFSKLLCDLLSALPDEFAFSVFNLASKLLTNEAGASALALMAGTNLFFLDRVEKAAFGKLETSDAPKHAANKNGLALEGWVLCLLFVF
jgi:thioredoxin 1